MGRQRSRDHNPQPKSRSNKTPASIGKDPDEGFPSFSFRYVDNSGRWAWSSIGDDDRLKILGFLEQISLSSWREIAAQRVSRGKNRDQKHHYQEIDTVVQDAKDRLHKLHLDEVIDRLYRFRLGGGERLWGFRKDGIFYLVWWDPNHTVYRAGT